MLYPSIAISVQWHPRSARANDDLLSDELLTNRRQSRWYCLSQTLPCLLPPVRLVARLYISITHLASMFRRRLDFRLLVDHRRSRWRSPRPDFARVNRNQGRLGFAWCRRLVPLIIRRWRAPLKGSTFAGIEALVESKLGPGVDFPKEISR
jgi:hypothetical protein